MNQRVDSVWEAIEYALIRADIDKEIATVNQQENQTTPPDPTYEAWLQLIEQDDRAAMLLHLVVTHLGENQAVIASDSVLAQLMGTSMSTIKRASNVLTEQSWLQKINLGGPRSGVAAYVPGSRIGWGAAEEDERYGLFNASVLISSKDQSDLGTGELLQLPESSRVDLLQALDPEGEYGL